MRAAKTGCAWMTYDDMDGYALMDERDGDVRGYVRFHFGRPEMWVRQLVVHPDHQGNATTARRLLLDLVRVAHTYDAQAIEGFVHQDTPAVLDQFRRLGAQEDAGVRVRIPLNAARRFTR